MDLFRNTLLPKNSPHCLTVLFLMGPQLDKCYFPSLEAMSKASPPCIPPTALPLGKGPSCDTSLPRKKWSNVVPAFPGKNECQGTGDPRGYSVRDWGDPSAGPAHKLPPNYSSPGPAHCVAQNHRLEKPGPQRPEPKLLLCPLAGTLILRQLVSCPWLHNHQNPIPTGP